MFLGIMFFVFIPIFSLFCNIRVLNAFLRFLYLCMYCILVFCCNVLSCVDMLDGSRVLINVLLSRVKDV